MKIKWIMSKTLFSLHIRQNQNVIHITALSSGCLCNLQFHMINVDLVTLLLLIIIIQVPLKKLNGALVRCSN